MSIQATATSAETFETHEAAPKRSFWSRLWGGIIAAREREARLRVSQFMMGLSDHQLRDIGYTEREVAVLRSTGRLPEFSGF